MTNSNVHTATTPSSCTLVFFIDAKAKDIQIRELQSFYSEQYLSTKTGNFLKKIRNQNALINQITNRNSNSFSSKNLKIKTRAEEEDRDYHRRGEGGTREFFDLLEKKLYVERWEKGNRLPHSYFVL